MAITKIGLSLGSRIVNARWSTQRGTVPRKTTGATERPRTSRYAPMKSAAGSHQRDTSLDPYSDTRGTQGEEPMLHGEDKEAKAPRNNSKASTRRWI